VIGLSEKKKVSETQENIILLCSLSETPQMNFFELRVILSKLSLFSRRCSRFMYVARVIKFASKRWHPFPGRSQSSYFTSSIYPLRMDIASSIVKYS
jgi:hypothetical protein